MEGGVVSLRMPGRTGGTLAATFDVCNTAAASAARSCTSSAAAGSSSAASGTGSSTGATTSATGPTASTTTGTAARALRECGAH
ncbi:type IV secretory pathway TrbL component [Bradyrhizobium sp. i1.3.6]